MNKMLEKYLMKAAGGLGKGVGYAKGAGEWAAKEHPMASGLALGGAGGLALGGDGDDDDDMKKEEEMSLLKKLGLL